MTSIAQRRVAGVTALMILLYLVQVVLFAAPSQANEHNTNHPAYWETIYPDDYCWSGGDDPDHGSLADGGKAVVLPEYEDDWITENHDHWEAVIVNGGAEDVGHGNGDEVHHHAIASEVYYPPLNGGGQQPQASHWIVCQGKKATTTRRGGRNRTTT